MTNSSNAEGELRDEAERLYELASQLSEAADILNEMRESDCYRERTKNIRDRAKEWMKK
jgi:hypothetical protein